MLSIIHERVGASLPEPIHTNKVCSRIQMSVRKHRCFNDINKVNSTILGIQHCMQSFALAVGVWHVSKLCQLVVSQSLLSHNPETVSNREYN